MTRRRWEALALAVGIFVAGGLAGAGVMHLRAVGELERWAEMTPAESRAERLVWALDRRLDLDDAQERAMRAILAGASDGEMLRRLEPRMAAARARVRERMRAVLRPDQHARFDAVADEREARYRRSIGAPPP